MTRPHLYSVEREFEDPIGNLWNAWTDAAALESWYHPVGMTSVPGATRSEMRVGGIWANGLQHTISRNRS